MSKFKVFLTDDKKWPIEINNGEGFGIQMNQKDAKVVLSELKHIIQKLDSINRRTWSNKQNGLT